MKSLELSVILKCVDRLTLLTKQIEIDFLSTLSDLLAAGEMTVPQAKQASAEFLLMLPFSSEDDMQKKVNILVEKYAHLEKFQAILLTYIDEEKTTKLLERLRTYIHKSE